MPELVFHWVVLGEFEYDFGLERSHRNGAYQQFLPDGKYGCLLHVRSLERPVRMECMRMYAAAWMKMRRRLALKVWQERRSPFTPSLNCRMNSSSRSRPQ